jgi:hypothetical protein
MSASWRFRRQPAESRDTAHLIVGSVRSLFTPSDLRRCWWALEDLNL